MTGDRGDDRRDVIRLDRVLPKDRLREGGRDVTTRRVECGEVGDEDRRPVAGRGVPEPGGELSQGRRLG
jgi:hypothetical protein